MTPDAPLPPADKPKWGVPGKWGITSWPDEPGDVQRPTPFTDEELAEHDNQHVEVGRNTAYVTGKVCRVCKHQWPCPTTRLVADLRANRARIRELEESITHCSGSCTL